MAKKRWLYGTITCLLVSVISLLLPPRVDEEKVLKDFFRCLFVEENGIPYVLYGNKPMCICNYQTMHFFDGYRLRPVHDIAFSVFAAYHPFNHSIKKGLQLWNRQYAHKPSPFLFKLDKDSKKASVTSFLLINKSTFFQTVQKHEKTFKSRLPSFVNAENFCQQCFSADNMVSEIIKDDDVLLGILLGFGKHNAELYDQRTRLIQLLKTLPAEDAQYASIRQEYEKIKNSLEAFPPYLESLPFVCTGDEQEREEFLEQHIQACFLPNFLADFSSEETQELLKSYEQTREKVRALYREKPFLEQTLSQFFPQRDQ